MYLWCSHMIVPSLLAAINRARPRRSPCPMQADPVVLPANDPGWMTRFAAFLKHRVLANVFATAENCPTHCLKCWSKDRRGCRITEYLENDRFFEATPISDGRAGDETTTQAVAENRRRRVSSGNSKVKKNVPEEALSAVTRSVRACASGRSGRRPSRDRVELETRPCLKTLSVVRAA